MTAYGKMSPQRLREKQTTTHMHNCVELFKQYEDECENLVTLY